MANPVIFSNIPGRTGIQLPPPNQGSAFSDGLRVGKVKRTVFNNGFQGVLTTPYVFTTGTFSSGDTFGNAISLATVVTTSQFLALNPTNNTMASTVTINGQIARVFDVPRNIRAQFPTTPTVVTVKVWGYDVWGVPLTEEFTTSGSNVRSFGQKIFRYVTAVKVTGATGGANGIAITGGPRIGFSYFCSSLASMTVKLNSALVTQTPIVNGEPSITFGAGGVAYFGTNFFEGYTGGTQTLSTADVRGSVDLKAQSSGSFYFWQAVLGAGNYDVANLNASGYPTQSLEGLYGLPQYSEPIA